MWMGKYLYYFVQSDAVLKEIGKQQRGTSYPAVRDSDIKAQFIPVPPKREVRRIVEAIELQLGRLDAAVARLQGAKARLKRYKQAVLKAAVDDAIENGAMVPLEELITSIGQGWSPKCLNEPSPNDETWGVIKTTAIQPGLAPDLLTPRCSRHSGATCTIPRRGGF